MTRKRSNANRRNALLSTGPKTEEGKARSAMNALKHGLRSSSLAVPYLENPEDWEAHRGLVLRDLSPVGYMETILSERVAALLWRMGRVVRYESEVVSIAINGVEEGEFRPVTENPAEEKKRAETLSRVRGLKPKSHVDGKDVETVLDLVAEALDLDLQDENISSAVEVPDDFDGVYWTDFNGWTRESLDAAVQSLGKISEDPDLDPWEEATKAATVNLQVALSKEEDHAAHMDRKRRAALLPEGETLDKVSRYETTLERSLFRTLHELQRLQAARAGERVLPPAAVDVDLSVQRD